MLVCNHCFIPKASIFIVKMRENWQTVVKFANDCSRLSIVFVTTFQIFTITFAFINFDFAYFCILRELALLIMRLFLGGNLRSHGLFTLNSRTGSLYLNSSNNYPVDREHIDLYVFTVRATDSGG